MVHVAQRETSLHRIGAVVSRRDLIADGITDSVIRANLDAHRWQRLGRAYVLHNGPLTTQQRRAAALVCAGPRAVLTSFTALQSAGLRRWERDELHVLIDNRARTPVAPGLDIRVHRTTRWSAAVTDLGRPRLPFAAVLAASSFATARPAVGLLAAVVQQRLSTVAALHAEAGRAVRIRHRNALLLALDDIGMGSQALSEIDFIVLCRRYGLPPPERQSVRITAGGQRRYLDALWRRHDGSLLAVEVDGSLHLAPDRWWADQLRQNHLVLGGATLLRFPSVVVREEPRLVAEMLRGALDLPTSVAPGRD